VDRRAICPGVDADRANAAQNVVRSEPWPLEDQLDLLVRLCLGGILLAAGASKLADRAGFVQGVLDFGVLPARLGRLYGRCLPFLELGAAGLLLAGIAVPAAAALAVLLLASFVIAVALALVHGKRLACHCFGTARGSQVGRYTLARSLVLLGAAGSLLVGALQDGPTDDTPTVDQLLVAAATAVLVVLADALVVEGHWRVWQRA
jgi:uncharacterized membrane protein YphA (DoxX/SURF4 family)